MNNAIEVYKSNTWICVDPPHRLPSGDGAGARFPAVPWADPGVTKVLPFQHSKAHVPGVGRVCDQPNAVFFWRNGMFDPETFLPESTFSWGCEADEVDALGLKGGRSVMLVALKVLYILGCKDIYIIGADFHMDPARPYAHSQAKTPEGCRSNNVRFGTLDARLAALRPKLEAAGVRVRNATPGGNMHAFDRIDYADAVREIAELRGRADVVRRHADAR
jgi:hypothetical protein